MLPKKRPRLVAITGSIASGKSEVCKWLENQGYQVYYADIIAHECLQQDFVKKQLYYRFGKNIFAEDGQIDRAKLAKIVFNNPQKLKFLNSVIHPLVRQKMQKIIDQSDKNLLIFEIPLLFEAGLQSAFDLTVNISVNKQVQQKRLQARDDISPEQQKQRMESQMGNDEKNEKADLVIDNNGSCEQLYNELYKLKLIIEALPRKPIDRLSDL